MKHFTKLAGQIIALLLAALVLVAFDAPAKANPGMTDLGTLAPGDSTTAKAINDNGQIVGSSNYQAYVWHNGVMTGLGSLNPSWIYSEAYGINNRGEVTGVSATPSFYQHAFIWRNGVMSDLGTLPNGHSSQGTAINDNGQVVGGADNGYGVNHAFLWNKGESALKDLGSLGGRFNLYTYSWATAVNNQGEVVGYSYTSYDWQFLHAFVWKDGVMTDLGVLLNSPMSRATAITNSGDVVGIFSASDGTTHAFLYRNGHMNDLGNLAAAVGGNLSSVTGINASGQLAGNYLSKDGDFRAFVYTDGKLTDLGTLGGSSSEALAINNRGEIVGSSNTGPEEYVQHAFLYQPDPPKAR